MAAKSIGTKGNDLEILIRQGATFGPHRVTIRGANNTPIDLTGCKFTGKVKKTVKSSEVVAEIETNIVNATGGIVDFFIQDEMTALIPAGETEKDAASQYVWQYQMEDASGKVIPLFYGTARVFRSLDTTVQG